MRAPVLIDPGALAGAIERAERDSPFLRRLLLRNVAVVDRLAAGGLAAALAEARDASDADPEAGRALRRERQAVALAVALADLAGAPLEPVVAALTEFADHALERALTALFAERTPGEPIRGFVALALGKQGSRELNYSSDIDPILLVDPETLPRRRREEPMEAAVRIARGLVQLLQEPTGDGYVLRVDLRLRPAAEITPLAVPIETAIAHYESSALPWERAAFIRARAAAGDIALGAEFLAHIRPFVWRRSLDFGAVRELRDLTRRIRDHHAGNQRLGPGYDLKRGRGGIREIEFFTQVHQLIHGGRDAGLRAPATLDALSALAAAGRITPEDAAELGAAYRLLRTVEHRLQMIDDRQTHRLPQDGQALDAVARFDGRADGEALLAALRAPVEDAGNRYDALDASAVEGFPLAPSAAAEALARAGFADPTLPEQRIAAWRAGTVRTTRSPAAREALEAVLPALVAALGAAPSPEIALRRFDDLVTQLPSAINLFRLLEARPPLLALLAGILSHAPALAAALARRADLLDGLIDATALALPPAAETIAAGLGDPGGSYEALLESVPQAVGERRFALGAQLVGGAADPLEVGRGYARVAEAAIAVLARAAIAEFEASHGRVDGGRLVILALGRLGGGMLTHASDLDIVYLFTGDFLAESDGRRPLGATTYFNRLAQRITTALGLPTAAGPLYEVDTRLRPSGAQGLLAVSLDSFARYQAEEAWTWEHMALARARPVFGAAADRAATQAIVDAALARQRDPAALHADVVDMRGQVARHKAPASPFDVKLLDGGLVDAEFAIHFLQLRDHIGHTPDLDAAAATLAAAGLLDREFPPALELLERLLIVLRLVAPDGTPPPEPSRALVAAACGAADWPELETRYAAARATVAREWRRLAEIG